MRSESNNANLLPPLFIFAVLGTSILLQIGKHIALQHGRVYLVTTDKEFSNVTAPHLCFAVPFALILLGDRSFCVVSPKI